MPRSIGRQTIVFLCAVSVFMLAACNTMPQRSSSGGKQQAGTVLGALAGVLAGSQIGKGSGRTAAMIVGALAGGYLGNTIGAHLDERDRQALAARSEQAFNQARDGEAMTWRSSHSGASARITPIKTETVSRPVAMRRTAAVQHIPPLRVLNRTYRAKKNANVRNAPGTHGGKVGSLRAGTTFQALGRTDNNWIAVGRKGVAVGYVHGGLVAPAGQKTRRAQRDTATDLDAMQVAGTENQAFDLDRIEVVEERVAAQTPCRTLRVEVDAKGQRNAEDMVACQAADGAWELS